MKNPPSPTPHQFATLGTVFPGDLLALVYEGAGHLIETHLLRLPVNMQ